MEFNIRRLGKPLSAAERAQIFRIAEHYYPEHFDVDSMLDWHLEQDSCVHVAEHESRIIGYSINSREHRVTPFYRDEIPLFYQRQLFVDPALQHEAIGVALQTAGLRYQLGPCWLFRRFAVTFLTANPQVLRVLSLYNEFYPRPDGELPDQIYSFCQLLGPMMGFSRVDRRLLVYGTSKMKLEGEDYTNRWKNSLFSGHAKYDQMVLSTVFEHRDGKLVHTGRLLLGIGYARPTHFIRRFLRILFKYHH